jgi:arylsulfatase
MVARRFPKLFNIRSDPFETADREGMDHGRWRIEHALVPVPAEQYVGQFLSTFKEFPGRAVETRSSPGGETDAIHR